MVIKKLKEKIGKRKREVEVEKKEEFIEIGEEMFGGEHKVKVRIEELKDYADADRIQNYLRDGQVIFLRIRELRLKDITELKKAVEKLKKTTMAINGDIIGVDEDFIVLTPGFARIYNN